MKFIIFIALILNLSSVFSQSENDLICDESRFSTFTPLDLEIEHNQNEEVVLKFSDLYAYFVLAKLGLTKHVQGTDVVIKLPKVRIQQSHTHKIVRTYTPNTEDRRAIVTFTISGQPIKKEVLLENFNIKKIIGTYTEVYDISLRVRHSNKSWTFLKRYNVRECRLTHLPVPTIE